MATHEIALLVAVAEGALQLVLLLCQFLFWMSYMEMHFTEAGHSMSSCGKDEQVS